METSLSLGSPLPRFHPDQPEDDIPPYASAPDEGSLDAPVDAEKLPVTDAERSIGRKNGGERFRLPRVVLGCATFGDGIFAAKDAVRSDMPVRVVRLALRSGMTAFDTAPWYHPSEIILGNALSVLSDEFPRESYQIITKVGKYGPVASDHTFEPDVVRKSVQRSLRRLKTDYLDAVYLHDVEFVASSLTPAGNPLEHLSTTLSSPPISLGDGDDQILRGISTLRELQSNGQILHVGIAAYPLPLLLRIALLVLHSTGKPLDVVQTYAHQTLANSALEEGYLEALVQHAKVGMIVSASPLGMGLLTKGGIPEWHPARPALGGRLVQAVQEAVGVCEQEGRTIEDVACEFGYRKLLLPSVGEEEGEGEGEGDEGEVPIPIVVGCKSLEEVHASLKCFARANGTHQEGARGEDTGLQRRVRDKFEQLGVRNWSWQSPLAR